MDVLHLVTGDETRPNAGSRNQDSLLLGQLKIPHLIVSEIPVPYLQVSLRGSPWGILVKDWWQIWRRGVLEEFTFRRFWPGSLVASLRECKQQVSALFYSDTGIPGSDLWVRVWTNCDSVLGIDRQTLPDQEFKTSCSRMLRRLK